jgi:hypothetical protein
MIGGDGSQQQNTPREITIEHLDYLKTNLWGCYARWFLVVGTILAPSFLQAINES